MPTTLIPKTTSAVDQELLERTDVLARTVISQQPFYLSSDCTNKQRQLLETMVGAAIWYLPQGDELWTGCISLDALKQLAATNEPKSVRLTKDHHYPRKVAASELFKTNWAKVLDPAHEILNRYQNEYGCFNYVLPEENKRLVKFQRAHNFVSPQDSYEQAGIELRQLSLALLKAIRKGDRELACLALSGAVE